MALAIWGHLNVIHLVVRFLSCAKTSYSLDLNPSLRWTTALEKAKWLPCMYSAQCCAIGKSNHTRLFSGNWNTNLGFHTCTTSSITHQDISLIFPSLSPLPLFFPFSCPFLPFHFSFLPSLLSFIPFFLFLYPFYLFLFLPLVSIPTPLLSLSMHPSAVNYSPKVKLT